MATFVMLAVLFLMTAVTAYLCRNSDGQMPNDWTSH
jgi:hypothetical protein